MKNYKESSLYKSGQMYIAFGNLLCDPSTTFEDLIMFGENNGFDVDMRLLRRAIDQESKGEQDGKGA